MTYHHKISENVHD